MLKVLFVRGL
jgi:hypothetical protein